MAVQSTKFDQGVLELAIRYAPILRFDHREPFLPTRVGVTLFWETRRSPSFSRTVVIPKGAKYILEYAIWWDWDIQHLYELEHVWVAVSSDSRLVAVEGSWHGSVHQFHHWQEDGGHPILYSQPGKHAFVPSPKNFPRVCTWLACTVRVGSMGLLVKDIFAEALLPLKSGGTDRLIRSYLRRFAFTPSFQFDQEFRFPRDAFMSWDELRDYIPERIRAVISELVEDRSMAREQRSYGADPRRR